MGKDFHLYKTKAAHDAGLISDYHEPWVSMTLGDRNDIRYNAPFSIYQYKYLTFEALEDNCTFTFTFHEYLSTEFIHSFSYSVDNGKTWVTTNNEDMEEVTVTTPAIDTGETILFKGDATAYFDEYEWAGVETSSSGEFNVSGNIMSLLYGDNFYDKYTITGYRCFFCFFGHDDDDVILNGFDNLVSANNLCLPATTLGDCCYESMFENCTSLTTAPELPATTLEVGCYGRMFAGCTSLTTAPELPATTLAQNCYHGMFDGTNLLPDCSNIDFTSATVVASGGLRGLFVGTKVTDADLARILPKDANRRYCLPVTTLTQYCYHSMFRGCTLLTTAPSVLPATTLASYCYAYMFLGCTSLTTAPTLPAITLVNSCYYHMFRGCSSLNYIKAMFLTDPYGGNFTSNWVSGVAATGTFVKNGSATWNVTGTNGVPSGWNIVSYLTFEALGNTTFTFTNPVEYSIDGGSTWTSLAANTATPTISNGNSIMFRANITPTSSNGVGTFSSTGRFNVSGNPLSLIYGDNTANVTDLTGKDYALKGLFSGCTRLISAENLMLKATTLSTHCYDSMFYNCTSLTTAPELPATTLVAGCYENMFNGCSSLNYIKTSFTTTPSNTYTQNWVNGVSATGTFIKDGFAEWSVVGTNGVPTGWTERYDFIEKHLTFEALESGTFTFTNALEYSTDYGSTWTSLVANTATPTVNAGNKIIFRANLTPNSSNGIGTFSATGNFNAMGNPLSLIYGDEFSDIISLSGKNYAFYKLFSQNTKLLSALNLCLTATTASQNCYGFMFDGCSSLTTAPELPATTLAQNCYQYMFNDCTSLTTAPSVLPATRLYSSCYYYMFNGCVALITAPSLPATTLAGYCYDRMFYGCTALTTAPALPATRLEYDCYAHMFGGCTSLTTAPALPATTLGDSCYLGMFYGCTSLTTAPALNATTLKPYCYQSMFGGCTSLITAPALPATAMANQCYYNMFGGCTALTTAPELPATTLAENCYRQMFDGCTSLTTAPALPATTLANYCYTNMFKDCTSLTTAPALPATTLAQGCYSSMFENCSSLNYIYALFLDNVRIGGFSPEYGTSGWVKGVAATGTFFKNGASLWDESGNNGVPSGWVVDAYLTFKALQNTTFTFTNPVEYSTDYGITWTSLAANTNTPTISNGNSIMFRASLTPTSSNGVGTFSSTGRFNASGNPLSLLYGNNTASVTSLTGKDYALKGLFSGCTNLVSTKHLLLRTTTLSSHCYDSMFYGCTALTGAPVLPAETLVTGCYENMFNGCSSLNYIEAAFTTTPSDTYTQNWVNGVAATGTFIKNDAAAWNVTGTNGIPTGWTTGYNCERTHLTFEALENGTFKFTNALEYSVDNGSTWTSLAANTNTPTVNAGNKIMFRANLTPVTEAGVGTFSSTGQFNASGNPLSLIHGDNFSDVKVVGSYAFYYLFNNNKKIVSAENLALCATGLSYSCYTSMFSGCTALTTAPRVLPATTLIAYCYSHMFGGCSSLMRAPEIYGLHLAYSCSDGMFMNCSNLNYIKAMFIDTPSSNYDVTYQWVSGVAATGTFVKNASATWTTTGNSGVPSSWTVQTASE